MFGGAPSASVSLENAPVSRLTFEAPKYAARKHEAMLYSVHCHRLDGGNLSAEKRPGNKPPQIVFQMESVVALMMPVGQEPHYASLQHHHDDACQLILSSKHDCWSGGGSGAYAPTVISLIPSGVNAARKGSRLRPIRLIDGCRVSASVGALRYGHRVLLSGSLTRCHHPDRSPPRCRRVP